VDQAASMRLPKPRVLPQRPDRPNRPPNRALCRPNTRIAILKRSLIYLRATFHGGLDGSGDPMGRLGLRFVRAPSATASKDEWEMRRTILSWRANRGCYLNPDQKEAPFSGPPKSTKHDNKTLNGASLTHSGLKRPLGSRFHNPSLVDNRWRRMVAQTLLGSSSLGSRLG